MTEKIRIPDEIIKEKLIDDDNDILNNYDLENDILYNYDLENDLNIELQNNILQDILKKKDLQETIKNRKKECESIKIKLNKMLTFDKQYVDIYSNLLTIIELYENNEVDYYNINIDKNEYYNIVNKFRTNENEKTLIKKLLGIVYVE
jgi:hypothetical protein